MVFLPCSSGGWHRQSSAPRSARAKNCRSGSAHFKGNTFAKAALDVAWWSLEAQRQGRPLHVLVNEASSASSSVDGVVDVAVGADFGVLDSIDELLRRVGEAFDEDFPV
ncbi:MAG: hypothetical protein R3C10_23115 [Pirellulales bacterium]